MEGRRLEAKKKPPLGHMDFSIFIAVLLLCIFGLVMMFSASYYAAQQRFGNGYYYVQKQLIYLAIGFVFMFVLSRIDYRKLEKWKTVALAVSVVLLILVLVLGKDANGAKRWLVIGGQSIQPSEIAKFSMMLYMCSFMSRKQAVMKDFVKGLVPMLLIIALICGLVLLQPNMSMAVIMAMLGVVLLYIGGANRKYIALLLLAGVILFLLLAWAEPYRFERLTTFTNPWKDPNDAGYQLVQSLYALGSGGLFGQGLNNSKQKLLYLTYGESDFVFSIIGEELGFVGVVLVILVYLFVIYRGIRIAMRCKDRFGSLLAAGITTVFSIQVAVNIGVASGVMPTTGQALPFISSGGSSLIIFLVAIGVLLNISRNISEL